MSYKIFGSILLSTLFFGISVQAQNIFVDEEYSDWDLVNKLYSDAIGDAGSSQLDFMTLKMSNDDRFVYFFLELDSEFDLIEQNFITMYIDTDNNPETGTLYKGIGFELKYNLGQREGLIVDGDSINSYDIGLVSSPTVTSTKFEMVIDLSAMVGNQKLFDNATMAVLFVDEEGEGDQMPNSGETLSYTLTDEHTFNPASFSISKPNEADIRVISYNTVWNNLFNDEVTTRYQRVLQALDPDFIAFQEVWDHNSEEFVERMELLVPSDENEKWYAVSDSGSNVLASRYPIIKSESLKRSAAFLVDYNGQEMFFIAAHPPCCNNDEGRQDAIDDYMSLLRDSKNGQKFNLKDQTPIFILGDMNLVGLKRQQETLLTGDILNNGEYGEGFAPDWDGTSLDDSKPKTAGLPNVFTWFDQTSSYSAGRLDYVVYSGSVLNKVNSFIFHTPTIHPDTLSAYGIQSDDSVIMSDHIPVVVDFSLKKQSPK